MDSVLRFPHIWLPRGFNREKRVHESRIGTPGSMTGGMQNLSGVNTNLYGSNIVPPAVNPTDWWDPDIQAFQDLAQTTPAIANNDPVASVTSQTGTGHTLVNTAGTTRPLLKTNVINGKSVYQFDGSNDYLKALFTDSKPTTYIALIRVDTWRNGDGIYSGADAGDHMLVSMGVSASPQIFLAVGGSSPFSTISSLAVGTLGVVGVRCQATTDGTHFRGIRLNNNAEVSAGTGATDSQSGFALAITANYPTNCGLVTIGRAARWNTYLSDSDMVTAMASFGSYYSLF